jgi:2-keto-4-pentenoate hydratase
MANNALLSLLIDARQNARLIDAVPPEAQPASLDEAYATADALAAWVGEDVAGWKIGASVPRGQQALGLEAPFGGRVFASRVVPNGGSIKPVLDELTIGAEYSCRIGRDLGVDETFDAESIAAVVSAVYPSLELNQVSYADPRGAGGWCIVADNGFNDGLVIGHAIDLWDMGQLVRQPVAFYRDGELQGDGCAADIGFNPLEALAWLANDRARRGDPLRAGQLVATGDLVGAIEAGHGSLVVADFGELGIVSIEVA